MIWEIGSSKLQKAYSNYIGKKQVENYKQFAVITAYMRQLNLPPLI